MVCESFSETRDELQTIFLFLISQIKNNSKRWTAEPHKRGVTSNQKSKNFLDICVRCRGAYFAWVFGRFELLDWRKALPHLVFWRYFSSVIFAQKLSNSSWFQVLENRLRAISRGFESHTLRQQKRNFCLPKVLFLFIQAAGLAYHHRAKCGEYHQGRQTSLVSHQPLWGCISPAA